MFTIMTHSDTLLDLSVFTSYDQTYRHKTRKHSAFMNLCVYAHICVCE